MFYFPLSDSNTDGDNHGRNQVNSSFLLSCQDIYIVLFQLLMRGGNLLAQNNLVKFKDKIRFSCKQGFI